MTGGTISPEQDRFLREHRWALVGTTGRAGKPQITMVAYHWDGHDLVMSIRTSAVKWKNLLRNPAMAVTVVDDRRFLTLHGTANCVSEDPARRELTERVRDSLLPGDAALLQADIDRGLDAAGRVVVRLVPERVVGRV